jgi:beta-lactamase class A
VKKAALRVVIVALMSTDVVAQEENWDVIREKTHARLGEIASSTRGATGFVVLDLTSGERFGSNDDFVFPQGSAIKIPILMEVYKQEGEGRFRLTDKLEVSSTHQVGGSGVLKELGDSTSELAIRDLAVLMVLVSDNTATNILIDLVGMENVNRTMQSLGLEKTRLRRRMIDQAASLRGDENTSTPAEAARIMEMLYEGEFLGRNESDEILSILRKRKRGGVNSVLPGNIPVPFKPGGIAGVSTEWAIVELPERPYIVVVMENFGLDDEASELIAQISRTAYEYFNRIGRATRYGTYVNRPRP